MIKDKIVLTLTSLLLLGLLGCQCDTIEDKTLYKEGNPKIVITKNCKEVLKYEHYTVDGELAFTLKYDKSEPQKPFEGRPWVHLIWKDMQPSLGDTIYLEIEMVSPPKITIELTVEDDKGTSNLSVVNGNYIYKSIANDTIENIQLKAIFFFDNEKWATVKKTIRIECKK
jgi:hypothetical protein